jgi:hypothetical protein
MKKLLVLVAGGVGYVMGTKAGRERYEQLRSQFNKVKDDPRVQEKTQQAADLAKEKAPIIKDKVSSAAGSAADKATPSSSSSTTTDTTDQLNPDRIRLSDDSGPQGPLP